MGNHLTDWSPTKWHTLFEMPRYHYNDVIMGAMASQITSLMIVYSIVYSGTDEKKAPKFRVTGLCAGNSLVTGEFPAQRVSDAENVSIRWRHHVSFNWEVWTSIRISAKFVPIGPIFNSSALVHVMTWCMFITLPLPEQFWAGRQMTYYVKQGHSELTHRGRVTHIYVIETDHHWFR